MRAIATCHQREIEGLVPLMKDRADKLLVAKGYFPSRSAAQAAIAAGGVTADGARVEKPSQLISSDMEIVAQAAHPYVSRGGLKLAHALDVFGVDPDGRYCLDIGASTGGFVDVLLQRGADHVVAIDVGRGQLHERLAGHERVTSLEQTDARALTVEQLRTQPTLIVCDVSFIALEKLLDVPLGLAADTAECVGLFKPQFQVGRAGIGKGGLVKSEAAADEAASDFTTWMEEKGWPIHAWTASPIAGGDGNAERLFHAVKS